MENISHSAFYSVHNLKKERGYLKNVFDLSLLDGVLSSIRNGKELEEKIKAEIVKTTVDVAFRERYIIIPISGNRYDAYAFEFLDCYISLHAKRVYSNKTWKPVKDIYTIEAYRIRHANRRAVWENFSYTEFKRALVSGPSDVERVDSFGNPM